MDSSESWEEDEVKMKSKTTTLSFKRAPLTKKK